MADAHWTTVTAALAATLVDGWRVGATALWVAGRRREAAWLRAEYRTAPGVLASAGVGGLTTVRVAVRRCRAEARRSAQHSLLGAPWREAARALAVAVGLDARRTVPGRANASRVAAQTTQARAGARAGA